MNVFFNCSIAVQENMIRDVQTMIKQECNKTVNGLQARSIAITILKRKKDRGALYRITRKRLCKLADNP